MKTITRAILAAAVMLAAPATALASEWTVVSAAGLVKVSRAGHWHALTSLAIPHGAWIKTGTRGSLTIERDGVRVDVQPRSLIGTADLANEPGSTAILQRWGTTTLDVEPRQSGRVKVHTPFAAAVVKGTRFDVHVDRCFSDVHVHEGEVAVEDAPRGEAVDIRPGQRAGVGRGVTNGLRVSGGATAKRAITRGRGLLPGLARNEVVHPGNVLEPAMRLPRRPR